MSAGVEVRGGGVRFEFDGQRRVLSPSLVRWRRPRATVWGVRGLDLDIGPGEGVALIGPSGSGKSTLLRLIAGVLPPDEGTVAVRGRVGTLLATQAGLLGRLTGRENAELLAVLNGLSREAAREAIEPIKAVSGLGSAFELPCSSYSQGMQARLGFAAATQQPPGVLLLDEVHEALDHEFRAVVAAEAHAIRKRGGIVIAAGHDHTLLATICSRGLLMQDGDIVADGTVESVTRSYLEAASVPVGAASR